MQRIVRHPSTLTWTLAFAACLSATACGDDSGGSGGSDGSGGDATGATDVSSTTTGSASSSAGTTTSDGGAGGGTPTTDVGSGGGGSGEGGAGEGGEAPVVCTQAREDALGVIDTVSEGEVLVLEEGEDGATLYIDASAGGLANQGSNPWIYIDLDARARVDVSDIDADTDPSWDLALKRPILRVNGDDGGPAGSGESAFLAADFDAVTAADVDGADFNEEHWFDQDCNLITDPTGAISTSFDGWYLYEDMVLSPAPGTWLVRGGGGDEIFKLAILDYYANPDGSHGQTGGRYGLRVARLVP